ncbi:MAG: SDR family NAD(P)-dependent oxidoreductase [Verrucomicrobia bacterium]|nr:SDR family NAD(P)-dependent oxidoreductase [Verrucomicrobiota bacterium]
MNRSSPSARLRLENQVAVLTGGARGIGAGIARRFVEEGARVVFSEVLRGESMPVKSTRRSDSEMKLQPYSTLVSGQADVFNLPFVPSEVMSQLMKISSPNLT